MSATKDTAHNGGDDLQGVGYSGGWADEVGLWNRLHDDPPVVDFADTPVGRHALAYALNRQRLQPRREPGAEDPLAPLFRLTPAQFVAQKRTS